MSGPRMPGGAGRGAARFGATSASSSPPPPAPVAAPGPAVPMPTARRGPGALSAPLGSPAVVTSAPLPPRRSPVSSASRAYPARAVSPLWWALATVVLGVATAAAVVGAGPAIDSSSIDTFDSSGFSTFEPLDTRSDPDSDVAGWLALAALGLGLVTYACAIGWIATIGTNGRTFGVGLVLLLFLPWYLPLALLGVVGFYTLLAVWIVMLVWPYRLLVQGIWEAGGLPSVWGALGWLPLFLGYPMMFGPTAVGIAGIVLICIANLFNFGSLMAVTVIQHLGIRADRRARRAELATA